MGGLQFSWHGYTRIHSYNWLRCCMQMFIHSAILSTRICSEITYPPNHITTFRRHSNMCWLKREYINLSMQVVCYVIKPYTSILQQDLFRMTFQFHKYQHLNKRSAKRKLICLGITLSLNKPTLNIVTCYLLWNSVLSSGCFERRNLDNRSFKTSLWQLF